MIIELIKNGLAVDPSQVSTVEIVKAQWGQGKTHLLVTMCNGAQHRIDDSSHAHYEPVDVNVIYRKIIKSKAEVSDTADAQS